MKNFKAEFDFSLSSLDQAVDNFPWENAYCYALWLAQTYYFVNHSTRLLALASSQCSLESQKFHVRFLDHLKEERGHEKLALQDLKILDRNIKDIPELAETSGLYQSQYYWITQKGSASFFGYLMALEGIAVRQGPDVYGRVRKKHGEKATQFLRVHVQEDEGHMDEAFKQVSHLDFGNLESIIQNLRQSAALYGAMLERIEVVSRLNLGPLRKLA